MSETKTENVENVENTESVNENPTENNSTENTETESKTLSHEGDEVKAPEKPKWEMPKTSSDFVLVIPEGHEPGNRRDPVIKGLQFMEDLGGDILAAISEINEKTTILAKQTDAFKPENLLITAESDDDPEIKKAWAAYDKLLKRVEEAKQAVIKAVTEKLGDEKLDDEAIKALDSEIKSLKDTVKVTTATVNLQMEKKLSGENLEFMKWFIENLKVPGMRSTSGTGVTSGAAEGSFKPRLKGGKVTIIKDGKVSGSPFPNFVEASRHVSSLLKRPVTANELGQGWIDKHGVGTWQEIPEGLTDYEFGEGISVNVEKRKDKPAE